MSVLTVRSFTLFALFFDLVISLIFSFRLYYVEKEKKGNRIITLFKYFYIAFSAFFLVTPFYLPNLIFSNLVYLKYAFLVAYAILLVVSNIIFQVFLYITDLDKFDRTATVFWMVSSALLFVYLTYVVNPSMPTEGSIVTWGFTPFSISLFAAFVSAPFILASVQFFRQYLRTRSSKKYLLLALSLLLFIVGGPLHQFGGILSISADATAALGFTFAFVALLIE